ncbi:hypothetical protein BAE44_0011758 [Dichanthelium oligosanthes]|uniref:Uncharacterized protein n=1 Tax=Dichanthelium oligosanthes TaxID=888268 RepID=A0A1E5VQ24_9POAL|nr:hypothetical protein BAE44_0011758 [Dichanthelium oligosanthes]
MRPGCCGDAWENMKSCLTYLGLLALVALVVAGIVLVPAYGILRHAKITVEDASLTRFALVKTPVTLIAYNLTLKLEIHNPNWAIGIKYDEPLVASYNFDGQPLDRVQVAGKGGKVGARRTAVYRVGSSSAGAGATLGSAGEAWFREQNATGVFEVAARLTGKFKYTARYTKCELVATCPLKLRLTPPGTMGVAGFERVTCTLDKAKKYC